MKTITFIIPSFNVERYLNTVLESFITNDEQVNQEIEVIVVDDGSSDTTADIAIKYNTQRPNMFRLLQKENGGHGSAINIGTLEARGKYFKVIDADDWVVTENLKEFLLFLKKTNADVVLTPFHMVDMNTRERTVQKMYISNYDRSYTSEEIASDWKSFDRCTTFHGVTYRTDFYNQNRHELPEKIFYEDQEYATIPFCHAKNVAVLDLMIYQYLVGNSQQSVALTNQLKRISHLETIIYRLLDYWNQCYCEQSFCQEYFLNKIVAIIYSYYFLMCVANTDKRDGRNHCKIINTIIRQKCPVLYRKIKKNAMLYFLFSYLKLNERSYYRLLHSRISRLIRGSHKIEKE